MNYKMNRLLRVMLIICITILLSVHNLCAQEVWEELVEQLMDEVEYQTTAEGNFWRLVKVLPLDLG